MSFKDRSCSPVLLESGLKSFLGAGHNYPLINGKFHYLFLISITPEHIFKLRAFKFEKIT